MTRKRSCVVRERAEGKGPKGTSPAAYFISWERSARSNRRSHARKGEDERVVYKVNGSRWHEASIREVRVRRIAKTELTSLPLESEVTSKESRLVWRRAIGKGPYSVVKVQKGMVTRQRPTRS